MWIFFTFILSNPVIIGNTHISSKLILKALKESPENLLNLYKTYGFIQATVKIEGDTILIEEGPKFKTGRIKLSGNKVFKDYEILQLIKTRPGEIFSESNFTEDMETIIKKYEDIGYPFCKIKSYNFELIVDSVNFELCIDEGPLVRINNIIVKGNKVTRDYVILRELNIKQGDIFCGDAIHKAETRPQRLKFIELEGINLVGKDELEVIVKERPVNHVDGIVGYREKRLIGVIDLEILNLLGTGRAIFVRFEQPHKFSTLIEFGYKEPWLFGYRVNLNASGSHCKEDTTYIKDWVELLLESPITSSLTINSGISGNWVDHYEEYRGILGMDFDTQTRSGVHYRIKTEYNFNSLEKLKFNFDNYLSIHPSILLFLSANYGKIFKKEVPIYDKFKLGGARTLRGYWEEEFSGNKVGWINFELRKFVDRKSFVFLFYDIGYIDGNIKHSYGVGIPIDSPLGLITVAYGLAKGAPFMEGKIHLSIKSSF
ncbi:MAG: POTRA domain-containing protein [bacterium]|nr:POTRA domain-containing protein [bacterium]